MVVALKIRYHVILVGSYRTDLLNKKRGKPTQGEPFTQNAPVPEALDAATTTDHESITFYSWALVAVLGCPS